MPYADAGDVQIYYESHGEGPALFLLHGGGGNTLVWFNQVPVLSRHYRVITMDFRGFKASLCPPDRMGRQHYANDIQAVMAATGIDKAGFIGQSLGGMAATHMAVRHPDRVSALVNAHSPTPIDTPENRTALKRAADIFSSGKFGSAGSPIGWNREFVSNNPRLHFLYEQIKSLNPPGFAPPPAPSKDLMINPAELTGFTIPTLIIGGASDDLLTPNNHHHVASLIPGAKLHTMLHAGHNSYFESPEEYNHVVLEFLANSLPKPKTP